MSVPVNVCVCTCACACACVLVLCECWCIFAMEHKWILKYNLRHLSAAFICLRHGVFVINHCVCQVSWPTIFWVYSCLCIWDFGHVLSCQVFMWVLGSYNLIIHPCASTSLPTEAFPRPLSSYILVTRYLSYWSFLTSHSFLDFSTYPISVQALSFSLMLCRWVLGLSFCKYLLLANEGIFVTVMLRLF